MFKNHTILITGGTGSFGNAVMKRFIDQDVNEIRIFSRDEKKQDDMRRRYGNENIKFYIGDVRDQQSVMHAVEGVDFIFHAAALKQVPSCEFHPLEAVKTNILGTENVLDAALRSRVKRVVVLSTDKAVYPVNAMGISKALMEKVAIAKSRQSSDTTITVTRYGNVMGSRGSVIPLFIKQMLSGGDVTVTDPEMTRFMMTLEDAVDLVLFAFKYGNPGEIFVQKAPAATIDTLVHALHNLIGGKLATKVIGTRHGEKLYETLLSREEFANAEDLGKYFKVNPDLRDLNYAKYIEDGDAKVSISNEYNSHNTERLDVHSLEEMLMKVHVVRKALSGIALEAEE